MGPGHVGWFIAVDRGPAVQTLLGWAASSHGEAKKRYEDAGA
jgi:hypothetical protein